MKVVALPEETWNKLVAFLNEQPLGKVANLYNELMSSAKGGDYADPAKPTEPTPVSQKTIEETAAVSAENALRDVTPQA